MEKKIDYLQRAVHSSEMNDLNAAEAIARSYDNSNRTYMGQQIEELNYRKNEMTDAHEAREESGNKEATYPRLVEFHSYLYRELYLLKHELLFTWRMRESATDNLPICDYELARMLLKECDVVPYQWMDLGKVVHSKERLRSIFYYKICSWSRYSIIKIMLRSACLRCVLFWQSMPCSTQSRHSLEKHWATRRVLSGNLEDAKQNWLRLEYSVWERVRRLYNEEQRTMQTESSCHIRKEEWKQTKAENVSNIRRQHQRAGSLPHVCAKRHRSGLKGCESRKVDHRLLIQTQKQKQCRNATSPFLHICSRLVQRLRYKNWSFRHIRYLNEDVLQV